MGMGWDGMLELPAKFLSILLFFLFTFPHCIYSFGLQLLWGSSIKKLIVQFYQCNKHVFKMKFGVRFVSLLIRAKMILDCGKNSLRSYLVYLLQFTI